MSGCRTEGTWLSLVQRNEFLRARSVNAEQREQFVQSDGFVELAPCRAAIPVTSTSPCSGKRTPYERGRPVDRTGITL